MSVGAVVVLGPVVGIPVVVRVVRRCDSHRESVRVGGVLGLVVAVAIAVGVLPLRGIKRPDIRPVDRGVPLENRPLTRGVTRPVAVGVEAPVAVSVGRAVIPRTVIAVHGIGVIVAVAIAVVVGVLRGNVGEEVAGSGVGVEHRDGTAIHTVVVAKAIAIGVKGLLPVALEHVTVKVRGIVVGPPVLVEVFATEPVNPRGPTLVVTAVDVITVAVGIEIIASLEDEGG